MGNAPNRKIEQLTFDSFFDEYSEAETDSIDHKKVQVTSNKSKRKSFPIQLIIDFDQFMEYISNHAIHLTAKNEYISKKFLPEINNRLSVKAEHTTKHSQQESYPYIHFFYHLALSGQLIETVSLGSNKPMLRVTERWNLYQKLTDTEKYFFLLETFWVDVNWANLKNKHSSTIHQILPEVFGQLLNEKNGYLIQLHNRSIFSRLLSDWNYFFLYFDWLGLWISEKDQESIDNYGTKSSYFAKFISATDFGIKMIPILLQERNLEMWNISLRRQHGEVNPIPGSPLPDAYEQKEKLDQSTEPFYQAFAKLYYQRDLQQTLPRLDQTFTNGVHTFKVALNGSTWRKVVLSANHTMQDLHQIIIQAFGFDDDHLYSFFMDNKQWSQDAIVSAFDNDGQASADEVTIGSVGMRTGQRFLYLFDYGDEWLFHVTVEGISENVDEPGRPFITASKGESPEQYPF